MQDQDNFKEPQKSKYNEAQNQISRLDDIWRSCHNYRKKGLLWHWNVELDSAWSELSGDTKHVDSDVEKKYYEHNKLIVKYKQDKAKLYQLLLKKEIWLRRLQNKQGKGTSYIQDEDDFD